MGADADRMALRYIEENDFGVTPDGNVTGLTLTTTQASKKYAAASGLDVFYPKQTVLIAGLANAASNGYKTVVSASATELIVEEAIGANEAAVAACSILTAYKNLRFTGEGLEQTTDTTESQEISSGRQVSCMKRTDIAAAGPINFEWSYGTYDDFVEAALQGSWSTEVTNTETTYAAVASGNKLTDSGNGFLTDGFLANQWIKIEGFTGDTSNNGYAKIVSVIAGEMVLSHKTLVDDAAGESVTLTMGAQAVNGTTERTFSMEKDFTDITQLQPFSGMAVDGFSLSVAPAALVTGVFALMGKKQEVGAVASTGDGTPKASTTVCPMNAVDEVLALFEDGSSREASAFNFAQINNARARKIIALLGAESLGYGRIGVTGGMTIYFEDSATHDKYLNFDDLSIAIVFVDNDGNAYIIDFPKLNFTAGPVVAGGTGTDVVADMSFTATKHATEDVTMRVVRFAA